MTAGYLLDTSVISTVAPGRVNAVPDLVAWMRAREDRLFLPVIAIAEIEAGISKLRRLGADRRADAFAVWLDELIEGFGSRILLLDLPAARVAGRLSDEMRKSGRPVSFADVAIAAIASASDLLILTANVRHFDQLGAAFIDPSEGLPE